MHANRLCIPAAALVIMLATQPAALAQSRPPVTAGPAQSQFPQLPLRREATSDGSLAESLVWAALLVAALAASGFLIVQRKNRTGTNAGRSWLRPAAKPWLPKPLGRISLTQQCSLHVVEWNGEELLLGCTPQAVSLLKRRSADPARQVGGLPEEIRT
jgi:hypothetical protein